MAKKKKRNQKLFELELKIKKFFTRTLIAGFFITQKAIVPSVIIMTVLNLFGYPYSINSFISSLGTYFVLEEIKGFLKEMKGENK